MNIYAQNTYKASCNSFFICLYYSSEETLMTARWYAAWILCFDITIVFVMYGLWVTLSLTGRLGHSAEIAHKHSMTGLNLSGGNGVLSYEAGDKNTAAAAHAHPHSHANSVSGSGVANAVGAVNSAKYKYAGLCLLSRMSAVLMSPARAIERLPFLN